MTHPDPADTTTTDSEIVTINPNVPSQPSGASLTQLTINGSPDYSPKWSKDGTRIVFTSMRDGNEEIYVMNANGGGQTRLTNKPGHDFTPSWSPDGKHIVFASDRKGGEHIWVMDSKDRDADGNGDHAHRLTHGTARDQAPVWSPGGRFIAFARSKNAGPFGIFLMRPVVESSTNRPRKVAIPGETPDWAPDGKSLAFAGRSTGGDREIFRVRVNGAGAANLTLDPSSDLYPAWAPDGTRIAFQTDRLGDNEIFIMDVSGSVVSSVANFSRNVRSDIHPTWQPLHP